jgi:hypothetical protein
MRPSACRGVHAVAIAACLSLGARLDAQSPSMRDSTRHAKALVLGVYDGKSGAPLEDVEVIDVLTGDHVRTSNTGTAPLQWVSSVSDSVAIHIRKLGYRAPCSSSRVRRT